MTREELEFISFLKSGDKRMTTAKREHGILSTAADWEMVADIGRRMSFPQQVAVTQSRPDIVLWSAASRQVVMLEQHSRVRRESRRLMRERG